MALKVPKDRRRRTGFAPSGAARSRSSRQKSRQTTVNIPLMAITLVIGLVCWFIGRILYSAWVDSMPRPLLIGILFAGLCFVLCFAVYFYSKIAGIFEQNIVMGGSDGGVLVILLLAVIAVFLLAMLFQWVYGLDFGKQVTEPTSYVFLIDDSGSMEGNDPSQERYRAISDVLDDMPDSFEYMVYGFSNDAYIVRDMAPISDGVPDLSGNSSGGTAIRGVLDRALEDHDRGIWNGGENPKVILLTDGAATDIGLLSSINSTLRRYAAAHISVSTVGLGNVDVSLMTKIAQMTGGVFIDVEDAGQLSEAMRSAASAYTSRDLLTARYQPNMDFLYGLMRVLFLSILGMLIGIAVAVAYGLQESVSLTMVSSLIMSVIGALAMELGTGAAGLSGGWMWLALWLLIATTIAAKISSYRGSSYRRLGAL